MKFFVNLISYTESGWIEVDATSEQHAKEKAREFKSFVPCEKRRWDLEDVCRPDKRGSHPNLLARKISLYQTTYRCFDGD